MQILTDGLLYIEIKISLVMSSHIGATYIAKLLYMGKSTNGIPNWSWMVENY